MATTAAPIKRIYSVGFNITEFGSSQFSLSLPLSLPLAHYLLPLSSSPFVLESQAGAVVEISQLRLYTLTTLFSSLLIVSHVGDSDCSVGTVILLLPAVPLEQSLSRRRGWTILSCDWTGRKRYSTFMSMHLLAASLIGPADLFLYE